MIYLSLAFLRCFVNQWSRYKQRLLKGQGVSAVIRERQGCGSVSHWTLQANGASISGECVRGESDLRRNGGGNV